MAIKTITVKGAANVIRKEGIAVAAITPGHLLERVAAGVQVHSTAAKRAARAFAVENEVVGGDIDAVYAALDTVLYGVFPPGAEVYAILADSQTVVVGEFLESNGDGTLKEVAVDTATDDTQRNSLIAVALEAVTTSGAVARIRCEVL